MKLWKIMLAVIVAVLMISCVAMAEECEHENVYFVVRTYDSCTGVEVGDLYCQNIECNKLIQANKVVIGTPVHFWGTPTVKAPTCEDGGKLVYKCTQCDATRTIANPDKPDPKGHDWGDTQVVAPTCTEGGYSYKVCKNGCGKPNTFDNTDKLGHNFQWVTTKQPTCTEKGETTKKCINKGCTEIAPIDKPVEEIAALDHKALKWTTTKKPDCISTGLEEGLCERCNTVVRTKEIAKTTDCLTADVIKITISAANCAVYEHKYYGEIEQCTKCFKIHSGSTKTDFNTTVKAKAATCEEDGYTKHAICSICKATNKDYELKTKLGHDFYTADEIKYTTFYAQSWTKPTCEKAGKAAVWCQNNCGKTSEIVLPATGHEMSDWWYDAYNCEDGTLAHRQCVNSWCDSDDFMHEVKVVQAPGGHAWKIIGGKQQPTCTESGIVDMRCAICGEMDYYNYVPANGHSYEEKVTEPTCVKAGKKVSTCSVCGDKKTETIPATGHVVTKDVETKAPTCTEKGAANVVCVACDTVVGTKEIAALGHGTTKDVETKAATCTEKGSINVICTVCDAVVGTKEIAALGHGTTKEVVAKEAACEVAGSIDVICTVCDAKIAEKSIEALKHDYSWNVVTKPSPAGNGKNEYSCALCGNVAKVETVKYVKWYYNNTMTAFGPMTKELVGGNDWYRVTPVDLTVDGVYTYDLIASNKYIVGTVTITVNAGTLTVSYKTKANVDVKDEALLIYASKADLANGIAVTAPVGAAINAAETFGADTKVLVSLVLTGDYDAAGKGLVDASAAAGMIANID